MPSYAYEIEECDRDDYILDRDAIETESDPDILADWARGLEDKIDILSMQIEAFRENPREDRESLLWLNRVCTAKAATSIGITRVNRRRVTLGLLPNPLQQQVAALEAKLLTAKAEITALKMQAERAQ